MRHGQRDALRRSLLPLFLLALCALPIAFGFYLPGVAPTDYALGDEIRAKVLSTRSKSRRRNDCGSTVQGVRRHSIFWRMRGASD